MPTNMNVADKCCMLNMRREGTSTVLYSYLARFVTTLSLNVYVSMSYTG